MERDRGRKDGLRNGQGEGACRKGGRKYGTTKEKEEKRKKGRERKEKVGREKGSVVLCVEVVREWMFRRIRKAQGEGERTWRGVS